MQGIKNLTDQEAEAIIAKDRESHQRDLYESIERGDFPKWKMFVQLMTEEQARNCPYNPFDLIKVWSQKEYPLVEVGIMELNRNPENYFADVEQAAFNPANVVPGISFSPDRMLLIRRYTALPSRREPSSDTCKPQSLSVPEYVSPRRTDACGRQSRFNYRLRA